MVSYVMELLIGTSYCKHYTAELINWVSYVIVYAAQNIAYIIYFVNDTITGYQVDLKAS